MTSGVYIRTEEWKKAHPNFGNNGKKGKEPWNKNLTRENDERVLAYSNKLRGKSKSKEHIEKIKVIKKKQYVEGKIVPWNKDKKNVYSEETLKSMSTTNMGKIPWNKGLTTEIDERVKRYGESIVKNAKINSNYGMKGKIQTKKTKQKMRISSIEYIKNIRGDISPNIGLHEKQILDEIQNIIGFSIKRAFYINGYFLDGYCQELNIAFEIDEEHHYKNNILRQKDIEKQNNIMKALNCDFIRIRVKDAIIDEKVDLEVLKNKIKTLEQWK